MTFRESWLQSLLEIKLRWFYCRQGNRQWIHCLIEWNIQWFVYLCYSYRHWYTCVHFEFEYCDETHRASELTMFSSLCVWVKCTRNILICSICVSRIHLTHWFHYFRMVSHIINESHVNFFRLKQCYPFTHFTDLRLKKKHRSVHFDCFWRLPISSFRT